jgi:hypothetical protein
MYQYFLPANKPVIEGLEEHETVYAKYQEPYLPLRTLRSKDPVHTVLSRWSPNSEQREAIAAGCDIFLELLTFGQPLQPIRMAVGDGNFDKDHIKVDFLELPVDTCTLPKS